MNRYWREVCYLEAMIETDQNLKLARADEALDAIKQRLFQPIRPGSAEDTRIRLALESLEMVIAECSKSAQGRPNENG